MQEKDLLDVIEYGIKFYRDKKLGNRFSLLEYYSLTDIKPLDLSRIAYQQKRVSVGLTLRVFSEKYFWLSRPLDMGSRLNLNHSIKGHELTPDDKFLIKNAIEQEEYPLVDGVFDMMARHYVEHGIEYASKENIRNQVISSYNRAKGIYDVKSEEIVFDDAKPKILMK